MPNRYLRESYKESEPVNSVSWQAEVTWTRLVVTVDDFGRCEANETLLRAKLFPLRLDKVREADLSRWLAECEKAGLVRFYAVDGKRYLQMMKWEKGRAQHSKFPDPVDGCFQPYTDANKCKQPSANTPDPDYDTDTDTDSGFSRFWSAYPRKEAKTKAASAFKRLKCDSVINRILAAITTQRESDQWRKDGGKFIPYPASWLNAKRWEDEAALDLPSGPSLPPPPRAEDYQ